MPFNYIDINKLKRMDAYVYGNQAPGAKPSFQLEPPQSLEELSNKLREARAAMPPRTAEEAYAQMKNLMKPNNTKT